MSSRILKWTVPVDDKPHEIGSGPVVHIASQYGQSDSVQVWTQEFLEKLSTQATKPPRIVQVFGTGHHIPHFATPLGSVVVANGDLVWHVVELAPPIRVV